MIRARDLALGATALAVCAASAPGDDAPEDEKPLVTGDVRTGWRFLAGEGEGRFPQDWGLKDGPRIFDLNLLVADPRAGSLVREAEVRLAGIGDPNSDYLISVRGPGTFDLSGGWRRDDYNYRATGDPFPYDTIRARTFVRGLWTPNRDLSVRLAWESNDRRGDAFTQAYSSTSGLPAGQHRTISQETDRFTLGADWAVGILRLGLTQVVGLSDVDDSRFSDAPPGDSSFDGTSVIVRSKTYATTAKAGVSLLDGNLDATLFVTRTESPLEERPSGRLVDSSGGQTPLSGAGKLRREALDWRFESSWRPHRDWEFTVSGEREDIVDEESGTFLVGSFVQSSPHARITDRMRRLAADAAWDATSEVRLRLGGEYLHEELFVPTDSHFDVPNSFLRNRPTDLDGASFRTTAGADWKPSKKLSLGALARISSNDDPQTTPVARQTDDWSLRARWDSAGGERIDVADRVTLTTLLRRKHLAHTGAVRLYEIAHAPSAALGEHPGQRADLDSATRAATLSQSAGWTHGPWSARGTVTYRRFDTSTDTAFGSGDDFALDTVSFRGRDVTASADVRYEVIRDTLRVFAGATRTTARGDYTARWLDLTAGAEYDLVRRRDKATGANQPLLTLGLTVSSWRLADKGAPPDNYSTHAVEASMTYHF